MKTMLFLNASRRFTHTLPPPNCHNHLSHQPVQHTLRSPPVQPAFRLPLHSRHLHLSSSLSIYIYGTSTSLLITVYLIGFLSHLSSSLSISTFPGSTMTQPRTPDLSPYPNPYPLQILCDSSEYEELPVRHNEDKLNAELAEKATRQRGLRVKGMLLLRVMVARRC